MFLFKVSSQNLLLHQTISPLEFMIFFVLITCLVDNVLTDNIIIIDVKQPRSIDNFKTDAFLILSVILFYFIILLNF